MSDFTVALAVALLFPAAACMSTQSTDPIMPQDAAGPRWQRVADFGGPAVRGPAAFAIGGSAYVVSGHAGGGGTGLVSDVWRYDTTTNSWTRLADFPGAARGYALSLALGTRGYVTQGLLDFGPGGTSLTLVRDLREYDPQDNTWTRRADLPASARSMAVGFVIGSSGHVGLGNNSAIQNLRDIWKLTP